MMDLQNKTALITGATSGIGKATATLFAEKGAQLILCGRRQDRLGKLSEALSQKTNVHTLNFDVRDKEKVFQQISKILDLPSPASFGGSRKMLTTTVS